MPLNDPLLKNLTPRRKSGLVLLAAGALTIALQSNLDEWAKGSPPLIAALIHISAAAGGILIIVGLYRFFSKDRPG